MVLRLKNVREIEAVPKRGAMSGFIVPSRFRTVSHGRPTIECPSPLLFRLRPTVFLSPSLPFSLPHPPSSVPNLSCPPLLIRLPLFSLRPLISLPSCSSSRSHSSTDSLPSVPRSCPHFCYFTSFPLFSSLFFLVTSDRVGGEDVCLEAVRAVPPIRDTRTTGSRGKVSKLPHGRGGLNV